MQIKHRIYFILSDISTLCFYMIAKTISFLLKKNNLYPGFIKLFLLKSSKTIRLKLVSRLRMKGYKLPMLLIHL
jgi:hypothetical protein